MTEDIVERLRAWARMAFVAGETPAAIEEAATTIESLRAQLATSHALGFKAGIEAGAEDCRIDAAQAEAAWPERKRSIADQAFIDAKYQCAEQISSLPTPPSILPEILEAMRPVAVASASFFGGRPTELVCARPWWAGMDYREPALNVGDLRAIAAVFAKHGGKL